MNDNKLVIGIDETPKKWYQWIAYSIQHVLAMFVANSLIAILVFGQYNINMVPAALISAGVGTLFYLLITKLKSPVFLGSSAALMPVMAHCLAMGGNPHGNFIALTIGLTVVGLIYVIVGLLIKYIGVNWLNKMLPPVIIGPVIMLIGLGLAGFATTWAMYNATTPEGNPYNLWSVLVAAVTMITIVLMSHYSKGIWKTIPFLVGILVGYTFACGLTGIGLAINDTAMQIVDFSIFTKPIQWLPNFAFLEAFKGFEVNGFNWGQIFNIILVAAPVAFVAICEHIGDHLNLSNIVGTNLLETPGLGRTLMGDGIGTIMGGVIGGMGNTTYGENVATIGVTKVASSRVIIPAAILAIILGFFGPLTMFMESIPYAVFGGAALILYGFIAMSGIKSLQKVDLSNTKNSLIISIILIIGVGGLFLQFGEFTFTSTALAMIVGIFLNLILKDNRKEKKANK